MMSMRFAVSMRVQNAVGYKEPRDAISHDWLSLVQAWDGIPVPIPNIGERVAGWLCEMEPSVVILTGGNDLIQRSNTEESDCSPIRDTTEFSTIDWARRKGVPVYAVCRGLHVVNLYFGGKIREIAEVGSHVARDHDVALLPPLLALAERERISVNSYHNLGLMKDDVAEPLRVCATATDDGLIEGVVHCNEPIVALQWHPERPVSGFSNVDGVLFRRLLDEGAFWKDDER